MRTEYRRYLFQSQKADLCDPWMTADQAIDKLNAVCAGGWVIHDSRPEGLVGSLRTFYLVGNAVVMNEVERPTLFNPMRVRTTICSQEESDSTLVDKFKDMYKSAPEIRDPAVIM